MADVRAFMLRNRRRLRQTFSVFDANGDGTVSVEEMVRGLQGINDSALTTEQIRAAIASLDSDRSGYITGWSCAALSSSGVSAGAPTGQDLDGQHLLPA